MCNPHKLSCYPHVLSCNTHVLSCNPHMLSYNPHVLSCNPHVLSCNLHVLSCNPHVLSCNPHVLSCNPHVLSCNPRVLPCYPHSLSCSLEGLEVLDFDYNCIKTDPLVAQFYEVGGWRLCVGLLGFAVVCVSVHNESAHAPLIGAPCCACAAAGKCRPCHGLQLLQALPWVTIRGACAAATPVCLRMFTGGFEDVG